MLLGAVAASNGSATAAAARPTSAPEVVAGGQDAPQQPSTPGPEFVPIDLTRVTASIVRVVPVIKDGPASFVLVRVQSSSNHKGGVEPVVFLVTPRGKDAVPIEVRRVAPPTFGRAGRAAFPGEPCVYPLIVPLREEALRGARFEVVEASAWLAPASAARAQRDVPVSVGELEVLPRWRGPDGQEVMCTAVPLTNLLDEAVDVILEADYERDSPATSLVSMRLQPREAAVLHVDSLFFGRGSARHGKVVRVKVVDWSIFATDGEATARRLFTEAWDGWYRLPETAFPLTASFRLDYSTSTGLDVFRGEAVFQADGEVAVRIDGAPSLVILAAEHTLERAAAHLTRPSAEVVLGARPVLETLFPEPVISLANHPTVPVTQRPVDVILRGGRVSKLFDPTGKLLDWESWTPTMGSAPWRLGARDALLPTFDGVKLERERVTWARSGDWWLPSTLERSQPKFFILPQNESTFSFERWSNAAGTLLGDELPTGPLADELRSAWDRFHRHALKGADVAGQFELELAAASEELLGRKQVTGTFVLRRLHGSRWRPQAVECVERRASEEELAALAEAVSARITDLLAYDLCCEPRFDQRFRGARLAREDGWITIDGNRYSAAQLVDGELAALRDVEGVERRFVWTSVAGARVPCEVICDERVVLEWEPVTDGWLWPAVITRPGPTSAPRERLGTKKLRVTLDGR